MNPRRKKYSFRPKILSTMSEGFLTPLGPPMEIVPGDSISGSVSAFIRVNPLATPAGS